jgi:hypothetical protein
VSPVAEAAITTLEDIEPAIELFHALIGLGRYDGAYHLFRHRLDDGLYYQLGAGRLRNELLEHLLPQGPGESAQRWAPSSIGAPYAGQRGDVPRPPHGRHASVS